MAKAQLHLNLGGPGEKSDTQKRLLNIKPTPQAKAKRRVKLKPQTGTKRVWTAEERIEHNERRPSSTVPIPLAKQEYAAAVEAAYQKLEVDVVIEGKFDNSPVLLEVGWMEYTDILLGLGLLTALRRYHSPNGAQNLEECEALFKRLCHACNEGKDWHDRLQATEE